MPRYRTLKLQLFWIALLLTAAVLAAEPNEPTMSSPCIFCEIVAGRSPVSRVYEDDSILAFMDIHPAVSGQCLIIPKEHIDHFTDVDDRTSQHIMLVAQHIGRRMREVFQPLRTGMVVHGFGVAHAHLILIPQHHHNDITSRRFARIEGDDVIFTRRDIPLTERSILDAQAEMLRMERIEG